MVYECVLPVALVAPLLVSARTIQDEVGPGCPGDSGIVPALELRSDVKEGFTIRADVVGTPGGSGLVLAGLDASTWGGLSLPLGLSALDPLFGSCVLYQAPAVMVPAVFDGEGRFLLEFKGWGTGVEAYFQVWNFDFASPPSVTLGGLSAGYAERAEAASTELFPSAPFFPQGDVSELALGDFDGDGRVDLFQLGGFPISGSLRFGGGDGSFGPSLPVPLAASGTLPVTADFDGDGALDFSVVLEPYGARVHRGLGGGQFEPQFTVDLGGWRVTDMAAVDVSGDGVRDLVALTNQPNVDGMARLAVALGSGDGNFMNASLFELPGVGAGEAGNFEVADLNGDGWADLRLGYLAQSTVWAWFGEGSGAFAQPVPADFPGAPEGVVAGDLDGDGVLELIASIPGDDSVVVVPGSTGGAFAAAVELPGVPAGRPLLGDLDQDGDQDLVVVGSTEFRVLEGAGDGSFGMPGAPRLGGGEEPQLVDLNGDQVLDLIVGQVQVALGGAGVSFQPTESYPTAYSEKQALLVDLDLDGALDRLSRDVQGRLAWMRNEGDGAFSYFQEWSQVPSRAAVLVDLDGNEFGDVISAGGAGLAVWQGSTDGPMLIGEPAFPLGTFGLGGLTAADFNADGSLDVLVADATGRVMIAYGTDLAAGGIAQAETLFTVSGAPILAAGNFNGDALPDFVLQWGSDTTFLGRFINGGDGSFLNSVSLAVGQTYDGVLVGDLDADGIDDLVLHSADTASTWSHVGVGDGTFGPVRPVLGLGGSLVQLGDVDGDGDLDVVHAGDGVVQCALNNGTGDFAPAVASPWSGEIYRMSNLADLNLDGWLDLVLSEPFTPGAYRSVACLGDGSGGFAEQSEFRLPDDVSWSGFRLLADFDGDGPADLLAGTLSSSSLVLARNLQLH